MDVNAPLADGGRTASTDGTEAGRRLLRELAADSDDIITGQRVSSVGLQGSCFLSRDDPADARCCW